MMGQQTSIQRSIYDTLQSLFWYCQMLNFVKALSRYALLKARYSVEDPFFEILRFGLRLKFDLVSEPNPIWSQNQIRFGLGTKSDLVSEPNPIWSRNQIPFGLGTKFHLVSEPNSIQSRTQHGFGLGPNSDLVSDSTRIWSRTLVCRNLVTLL